MPKKLDLDKDHTQLPYVLGRLAALSIIGKHLVISKDGIPKKLDHLKKFDGAWVEYIKGASRIVNYLSGVFDTIDGAFGKGYAKEIFDRVIAAHQETKADRKLREQVDLVQRHLEDPKHNASKLAREKGWQSPRNLNRWRKNQRIVDLARLQSILGEVPCDLGQQSLQEVLLSVLKEMQLIKGPPDKP
jgi:hypothetical protein